MKKTIVVGIVILIMFSSLFINNVKANDDWSFDNDENNFKVVTSLETLDYRIMVLDKDNCNNIDSSVSFDNNGDYKTISRNAATGIYNVPYIKNYNGTKCQAIIVRGNVSGINTHKYYARLVTGTGETVAPTPTATPSSKQYPVSKTKKQLKPKVIKESKENEEKDSAPTYGIVILGGVVIFGVVIYRGKGKKRKSINY